MHGRKSVACTAARTPCALSRALYAQLHESCMLSRTLSRIQGALSPHASVTSSTGPVATRKPCLDTRPVILCHDTEISIATKNHWNFVAIEISLSPYSPSVVHACTTVVQLRAPCFCLARWCASLRYLVATWKTLSQRRAQGTLLQ